MYTHDQVIQSKGHSEDLFRKPGVVMELLALIGFFRAWRKNCWDRHIDKQRRLCRIILWLVDSSVTPVDKSIAAVKEVVNKWKPNEVKAVWITGLLAVYACARAESAGVADTLSGDCAFRYHLTDDRSVEVDDPRITQSDPQYHSYHLHLRPHGVVGNQSQLDDHLRSHSGHRSCRR